MTYNLRFMNSSYNYNNFRADAQAIADGNSTAGKLAFDSSGNPFYHENTWGGRVRRGLRNRLGVGMANANDSLVAATMWTETFIANRFSIPQGDISLFQKVAAAFRNQAKLYEQIKKNIISATYNKAAYDLERYMQPAFTYSTNAEDLSAKTAEEAFDRLFNHFTDRAKETRLSSASSRVREHNLEETHARSQPPPPPSPLSPHGNQQPAFRPAEETQREIEEFIQSDIAAPWTENETTEL